MTASQLWVLIVLGIFHGFHPGMGWLLAVSRGLQERRRSAVVSALPLLALGHAASVALVAVAVTVTGAMTTSTVFAVAGAVILVIAGVWFLLGPLTHRGHSHTTALSSWQLVVASFVMACAHGSGLMLLPVLAGRVDHSHMSGGHSHHGSGVVVDTASSSAAEASVEHVDLWDATLLGLAATGVHTLAMLAATGLAALLVYEFFGVYAMRLRWVTMDRVWGVTLLAGGVFVLWGTW